MSLSLKNTSSYAGKEGGTDWWEWTAHIDCTSPDSLDDIMYVEYHLHPTFKNPVRRVHTKGGGFPLKSTGWGVFELKAKVVFKDSNKSPVMLSYYLEFEGSAPIK